MGARRPRSPYLGLASFGDGDAALFFGRDAERDLIIANLRATRLTVLYGPGGVGKSSLLHAGVVHRLREMARPKRGGDADRPTRPRTDVVILDDWSGDPSARLAGAIRALHDRAVEPAPYGDPAVARRRALLDAVAARRVPPAGPQTSEQESQQRPVGPLLIILDQFEEYLRLHPDPREHGFDEALAELVRDKHSAVRVLIAIREDRLADLDRFAGRVPQLMGNLLRLGPMSPGAALEAIEKPIEHLAAATGAAVGLEDGLALAVRDELVALNERRQSAGASSGSGNGAPHNASVDTSYLQLVMRTLWDADIAAAGRDRIRNATLDDLGGVDNIIATHLDGALDGLPKHEQAIAADMLRFLVTPSGATVCLTAQDLAAYTGRSDHDLVALAEKLSRPPARILRGVDASSGAAQRGGYELAPVLAEPAAEWAMRRRTLRLERRTRRLLLGVAAMSAIVLAFAGYTLQPDRLQRLELASVDARFDVRGAQGANPRIALVTRPGSPERNPRVLTAQALAAIATANPLAVALGIQFTGPARKKTHDDPEQADAAVLAVATGPLKDRLVMATSRPDAQGQVELTGLPDPLGDNTEPAVAWGGLPLDADDAVRRITPAVTLVPVESGTAAVKLGRLSVVAAGLADVPGVARPKPKNAWIDFRGGGGTFPTIALDDVAARRPAALAQLRDKVVLVGLTADPAVPPLRTSAPGASEMNPTELQANAISTALEGFPLRDGARGVDVALIVLLGLLPLALARFARRRPVGVLALGLLPAALFCGAAQLAFAGGWVIAVVMPLASLVLATLAVTVVLWRLAEPGARRVRDAAGSAPSRARRGTAPDPAPSV